MSTQENFVPFTPSSNKRSATMFSPDQARPTKRVALAELPTLSNVNQKHHSPTKLKRHTNKKPSTTTFLADDPKCFEYASDIYVFHRRLESESSRRPLSNYIEKVQTDFTANMRGILVDWLVTQVEEYGLLPDTLYLAVSCIDRYLSLYATEPERLQLIAVSSILIAAKYEEIIPPHVEVLSYMTNHLCPKEAILQMETNILRSLNYELGGPTVLTFLRSFTRVAQETYKNPTLHFVFLGCYLADLSLLDYEFVRFLPSLIAASVIFLARFIIQPKMSPWNDALQKHTGYMPSDLEGCVLSLHELYLSRRGADLEAVREKYKQHKFKSVAAMASLPEVPANYFVDTE